MTTQPTPPPQEPTILPVPPPPQDEAPLSPKWEWPTKIIIGLILLGILVFLIARFHNYLNLMITAFVVSILLQPLAKLLERLLRIKWRLAVLIVYLLVFGLVIFLIARGGVFILEQARSLVDSLQTSLLPIIEQLSQKPVNIGSFTFTLPKLDTNFLVTMVQERLVPLAGQAPGAVGKTVSVVGGFLFNFFLTFMVSLFITSESEATNGHIFQISIPGYEYDLRRMGRELSNTWNAFIRGEFIVIGTAILIFSTMLGILGLPNFLILGIIAGLGRLVPYVGAWVGWLAFGLTAFFMKTNVFGVQPIVFALIVIGISLFVDSLLDNVLTPKVMGNALEVHPAAILISALVMAQLFGLLGIVLAAPVLASLKLFLRYITRKLMDQDPWEGISYYHKPKRPAITKLIKRNSPLGRWLESIWEKTLAFVDRAVESVKRFFRTDSKSPAAQQLSGRAADSESSTGKSAKAKPKSDKISNAGTKKPDKKK